jgi:predicted NBD/HSP70 family sugar kinase
MSAKEAKAIVGVDVGATTTSAGLVTTEGEILTFVQTSTFGSGATPVEAVLGLVRELISQARERPIALTGIGVGLPGLVDAEKGMMIGSDNLVVEFAHLPLSDVLRGSTGLTTYVDNDVNVLALGERRFGAAIGADSLVMLAIGTGVGGALVIGDMLVRGHASCAGEFGHFPLDPSGPVCRCGNRGCLHSWLGGEALAKRARELALAKEAPILVALAHGDAAAITAELVFEAASEGDQASRKIVAEACQALGMALGTIMNTINPEVIVIAGGVAGSLVPLEAEIRRHAARVALAQALASTTIHLIPGDKRRTVLGGAALVLYERRRRGVGHE